MTSDRQSYFVAMPSYALDVLIEDPRLIQVWLVLASYADKDGVAWPQQETLAERCACNEKTIRRAIERLVECQVLSVRRTPTGNVYTLPVWERLDTRVRSKRAPVSVAKELDPVELDTPYSPPGGDGKSVAEQLWDALILGCRMDGSQVTDSARGALNRAVKALKQVDATPREVLRRSVLYRSRFPNAACTPSALVKHWPELVPQVASNVVDLYPGAQEVPVGAKILTDEEKEHQQAKLRELSERFRSERT